MSIPQESKLVFASGLFIIVSLFMFHRTTQAEDDSDLLFQIPVIVAGHHFGSQETPSLYGEVHAGQYHLGPVDFAETKWHNACAPSGGYLSELRESTGLGGEYLAGVSAAYNEDGGVCDRCILIKTAQGRSITARVVTYGVTNSPGDIDVSPSVYAALNKGEYPRNMTWQFSKCPETCPVRYEFQTGAHAWWSSLWVRSARVPVEKVEVKSAWHSDFFELRRGSDGTLTDDGGFGEGPFILRSTAIDGQVIEDSFPNFPTGKVVESQKQYR